MSETQPFDHLGQSLEIEYINSADLIPYENNPRTHSKQQVEQIARSMKQFGWTNPILIDEDKNIIAGHGRLEAAKFMGTDQVPIIELSHLTDAQKKAYVIADNKLAENAGWDEELLQIEIENIVLLNDEYDLTLTGFEMAEIDAFLQSDEPQEIEKNIPDLPECAVSKPGDLWHLGPHRILCADATQPESYATLMGQQKARLIFTDPPYNVPINGHVCGKGQIKHSEFKMASGEMSAVQFTEFLNKTLQNLCHYSLDGSLHGLVRLK